MTRHFASTLSFAATAAAIACAAAMASSSAYAETPTIDTTPFVSTRSRAEVQAELMGHPELVQGRRQRVGHATQRSAAAQGRVHQ